MKKITLIFLISLLLHFGLPPAQADDAPIKIGVYQNQPLAFVNEDGEVSGFCIDIIEEIAAVENWAIEYTSCGFSDCLDLLENHEIDLLCPIAYSQERVQRFDFNAITLISNWGHVYTQPNSDIESYLDLQGKTVAILENDIHAIVFQQMLERFDITCDFVLVEDYSSVFDSIVNNSVDAGVVNRLFSQQHEASYQVSSSTMIFNPIE
ncbi:transporter substrate-binding domain-containing protein, partial [Chloroflexota bacterium]